MIENETQALEIVPAPVEVTPKRQKKYQSQKRQERFCLELLSNGFDVITSFKNSGYSTKNLYNAQLLLKTDYVQYRLQSILCNSENGKFKKNYIINLLEQRRVRSSCDNDPRHAAIELKATEILAKVIGVLNDDDDNKTSTSFEDRLKTYLTTQQTSLIDSTRPPGRAEGDPTSGNNLVISKESEVEVKSEVNEVEVKKEEPSSENNISEIKNNSEVEVKKLEEIREEEWKKRIEEMK